MTKHEINITALLLVCAFGYGCVAGTSSADVVTPENNELVTSPGQPAEPELGMSAAAIGAFDTNVKGLFTPGKCVGCHAEGGEGPTFLRLATDPKIPQAYQGKTLPDFYASILAYNGLVNFESPESSPMLTKGAHAGLEPTTGEYRGPAWTAAQSDAIKAWIVLGGNQ